MKQYLITNEKIPYNLKKEFATLYQMGLQDYEISYLLYLKTKKQARAKWR
ncbi:MAG: hypothetical protein Q7S33_01670 [Nanoarchaeota archaeon]|nr:hypothetical protein [Nanoarchaeota archaeon]